MSDTNLPNPNDAQAMVKPEKAPVGFGKAGVLLSNLAELYRFAQMVQTSGMAPKGLATPEQIAVAVQYGAEFNVSPMAAVRGVRVINGVPGWMGDMALGIVRASGKMASYEKSFDGKDDEYRAIVTTLRRDATKPLTTSFSVADAKRAGLWGKQGPWSQYPERMLYYRALGFNLRDNFPDVMAGAAIAEELEDYPERGTATVLPRPALPAGGFTDPLLEKVGISQDAAPPKAPAVPTPATEPGAEEAAAEFTCSHPKVPPSALAGGKTAACPDCGEELQEIPECDPGARDELTLTAPTPARRSRGHRSAE